MKIVYGSNANLGAEVVPKVGAFVIEAAVLVQRTACLLLLLVALQHVDHSMLTKIYSDRRFSAADLVGVKEPLPENEDTGEMASQDPEDNGIGERDDDEDDDAGEDDSDDDTEGSDDNDSETDSDEGSEDDEDDDDEDGDDDDEDEDDEEDDDEDDALSKLG